MQFGEKANFLWRQVNHKSTEIPTKLLIESTRENNKQNIEINMKSFLHCIPEHRFKFHNSKAKIN